jgi:hypothetical protein
MNAFLAGLKKRHAKLGDRPILIHTSGTGMSAELCEARYGLILVDPDAQSSNESDRL